MNALVDRSAANNAVMNSQNADPFAMGAEDAGQVTFVKFQGASGQYLAGADGEEIPHGSRFVADLFNSKWIWQFWWDGKPLESVEAYLREDPLMYKNEPDFLPESDEIDMTLEEIRHEQKTNRDFRDGWSVQASFNMVDPEHPEEEYAMRLGYGVALNAFHSLRKAFSRRYKQEAGKQPVIELSANKYKSKVPGVGWRFAPVLKIVEWVDPDAILGGGDDEADYDDMAPQPQIEAPKEAAVSDEAPEAEAAPTTRRRGARGRRMV